MSTRSAFDEAVWNFHFGYLGAIATSFNWSVSPPPNSRSKLCAIAFRFTTSAVAGDRRITLNLNNGFNITPIAFPVVTQVASEVKHFLYSINGHNYVSPDDTKYVISISPDITLLEGWAIESEIENLKSGDATALFNSTFKLWTYEQ